MDHIDPELRDSAADLMPGVVLVRPALVGDDQVGGLPVRREGEELTVTIDPPEDLAGVVPVEVQAAVGTARWFAAAARELQDARGVHDTVQHIVELVADLAEADLAVVIGLATYGGLPQLLAATDYAAGEQLVALQRAAGAAPAWQVILDGERLQVDDLDADQRWPGYGAQVVDTLHFRSVLAFPLLIDGRAVASLAVYGRRPKVFGVAGVELAAAFAEHAAVGFHQATQAEQITNLETALEHARDIGAAVGIIMERRRITQREAFTRLRKASQDRNVKLYELALDVTRTGGMPF